MQDRVFWTESLKGEHRQDWTRKSLSLPSLALKICSARETFRGSTYLMAVSIWTQRFCMLGASRNVSHSSGLHQTEAPVSLLHDLVPSNLPQPPAFF